MGNNLGGVLQTVYRETLCGGDIEGKMEMKGENEAFDDLRKQCSRPRVQEEPRL